MACPFWRKSLQSDKAVVTPSSKLTPESATHTATKLDSSTTLALDRTCLAHDRTLMAWTRTATSLITFGFGFYKIVEYTRVDPTSRRSFIGPREFGLIMISIGLLALILGTYEHRRDMADLCSNYPGVSVRSSTRVLAALIAVLGTAAFVGMILRQ